MASHLIDFFSVPSKLSQHSQADAVVVVLVVSVVLGTVIVGLSNRMEHYSIIKVLSVVIVVLESPS